MAKEPVLEAQCTNESYIRMLSFDFKAIVAFITVTDTGDSDAAAVLLGCSSESIKLYLKQVQIFYGRRLFIREGESLLPTTDALFLCQSLKKCVSELSNIFVQCKAPCFLDGSSEEYV